jgi:hypothetical protein
MRHISGDGTLFLQNYVSSQLSPCQFPSETAQSHANPGRCKRFHGVLRRISAIFMASHSFPRLPIQTDEIAPDHPHRSRPRRVATIAILLYFVRMGFEDQQERLKRRLDAAPKRERAPCVASLLRAMRDEIAAVAEEKTCPTRTYNKCSPPTGWPSPSRP